LNWSDGYVTDLGYTRGYYRELNPLLQNFALAATGREGPDLAAGFTKVELGCGYGLSLLLEAAAFPNGQFFGIDFNPDHITWAQRTARQAGLDNVVFLEAGFADLEASAIPDCDFIGLHGVWSWVNDANRALLTWFMQRRLKNGGVAMVSYNAMPGWSAKKVLRELMMSKYRSTAGPTPARIKEAIDFAMELRALGASVFTQNPELSGHLDGIAKMPVRYLAHEYFNHDWHPFYQHEVAGQLASAKLSYLASCKPLENVDKYNFQAPVLEALDKVAPGEREALKDSFLSRTFRYDLYGRGIENLGLVGTMDALQRTPFVLTGDRSKFSGGVVKAPLIGLKLKNETYEAVIAMLERGPVTAHDIMYRSGPSALSPGGLLEILAVLTGLDVITPALSDDGRDQRRVRCRRLNETLMQRMMKGEDVSFWVSPVSGLGHNVANFFQLFIIADGMGKDPVSYAWRALKSSGKRMVKGGQMIEGEQENLTELEARFKEYETLWKPRWRQLGMLVQ